MSTRLTPIDSSFTWDRAAARHLLNRAGFGVPQRAIGRLVELGPAEAVASLVHYERFRDNVEEPDFLSEPRTYADMRSMMSGAGDDERRRMRAAMQRQQRQEIDDLKVWWLNAMLRSAQPLREKMALFWHGHFATSAREVRQPAWNHGIVHLFRTHATGNFRTLTYEVGITPAMLTYLNNRQNRKGRPNENWARELMELFTMGIGNYTEQDIKEAARAFTGHTERNGQFVFVERQHDFGEKEFLGRRGHFYGRDIVNIIFEQPQTARFISRKLWEYFVYENPDDELVEELAAILRKHDYELKPLLETIFLSREFHGARAREGQIKSPMQYMVMLADQLGMELPRGPLVTMAMRGLGQDLFYPPNVKGWPGNRAWIDTNTLLLRANIPGYLLTGERPMLRQGLELDEAGPDTVRVERNNRQQQNRRDRTMDVSRLFEPYSGRTAGATVAGLADYFLGRRLDRERTALLVQTLTGGSDPNATGAVPGSTHRWDNRRAAATLHLMLSMAEYQLC